MNYTAHYWVDCGRDFHGELLPTTRSKEYTFSAKSSLQAKDLALEHAQKLANNYQHNPTKQYTEVRLEQLIVDEKNILLKEKRKLFRRA